MNRRRPLAHPDVPDASVLVRIAERLKRELAAERVIVYGSVARGDATPDSDIDLLVIAPASEPAYLRMARALAVTREMSRGLPLSPLVLTPQEVERRLARGDSFLRGVLEEGVAL